MNRLFLITLLSLSAILGLAVPAVGVAGNVIPLGETTPEQAYVQCGTKDEKTVKVVNGQKVESAGADGVVDNPCQFVDVIKLAKALIMGWIIAGVTFATMGFAYAGLLYITAMGSAEKISHAHSIFTKTALGFVFMLSAWLIAYAMEKAFLNDEARGRSFLQP